MAGVAGVPEGERPWLSPRTVDDPASRPPCARVWTGGGTCVPRRSGARHGVQDSRPGRSQTAQSAILPRTSRSRFCGKDGRGAVRLSPGANLEGGEQADRAVAFIFKLTCEGRMRAGRGRQVGGGGCDGLDARLLIIGDDRHRLPWVFFFS